MSRDRDEDLARRLAELDPPDHRPDFWARVRADLTDAGTEAPHPDIRLVTDDDVVDLAERRERQRRFTGGLLVAAAVVLVALVSAGVVLRTGTDRDREADVATDPTLTEDPTTTTQAPGPLRADGEVRRRGTGRPVAVDPTGTFLYVSAPAPDGGSGCEGAPAEALFVERVDGDGSDRRPAVPPDLVDTTGGLDARFSDAGDVALVARCEGFGSTIVTGTVAPDGTVAEPTELTIPDVDLGRQVDGVVDLEFRSRGVLVVATWSVGDDGREHRHLYELPASPSEVTDLAQEGVVQVEVLDDGRLLTADTAGELSLDGTALTTLADTVYALDVAGSRVVVGTDRAVLTLDLGAGPGEARPLVEGGTASVTALGSGAVAAVVDEAGAVVVAFDVRSGERHDLVQGQGAQFVITPAADALFVAGAVTDPSQPVALLEQRLTR